MNYFFIYRSLFIVSYLIINIIKTIVGSKNIAQLIRITIRIVNYN